MARGQDALADVHPELGETCAPDAALVVSEPLTESDLWHEVPESTALIVGRDGTQQQPFSPG